MKNARRAATNGRPPHLARPQSGAPGPQVRETTHAETFYYLKQRENRTELVFRLRDREEIRGTLTWHDRRSFRVDLAEGSHLILQKLAVAYIYKAEAAGAGSDN